MDRETIAAEVAIAWKERALEAEAKVARLRKACKMTDDFFMGYLRGGGSTTIADCRKAIAEALRQGDGDVP